MRSAKLLLFLSSATAAVWFFAFRDDAGAVPNEEAAEPIVQESPFQTVSVPILPEETYGVLMEEAGVPASVATAIYQAAEEHYDLARIRAGRTLDLTSIKETGELIGLAYQIDSEEELYVRADGPGWKAERVSIDYEVKTRTVEGTIESSFYAAGLAAGLDDGTIITLAEVFQWTVDFALDPRVGDTFKFIYEERYRDGSYVMPGRVLAAKYVNDGREYLAFHFTDAEGNEGYFNEDGESMRKIFLKAPVSFKYITSGFTTGLRYVSAFNVSTGHRAIDYAAAAGTPIRAVGDGAVVYAGWNGPYGYFVSIRHNETYTTNYAHQSRLAVRNGQRVSQGQTIGYVGSTGFSTGPHLHYEMVKRGVKINPLREEFPSTEPVPEEEMEAFRKVVEEWRGKL